MGNNDGKIVGAASQNAIDAGIKVNEIINKTATVYVKSTTSKWYGVTYKEDKESVVNAINNYINEGKYPKDLWE